MAGERPDIPPWEELPGCDAAAFAGLDEYCQLIRWGSLPGPPPPPSPCSTPCHPAHLRVYLCRCLPRRQVASAPHPHPHHTTTPPPPPPYIHTYSLTTTTTTVCTHHAAAWSHPDTQVRPSCAFPRHMLPPPPPCSDCWTQEPGQRPPMAHVVRRLHALLQHAPQGEPAAAGAAEAV